MQALKKGLQSISPPLIDGEHYEKEIERGLLKNA
jgi:hypothetical protein